MRWDNLFDDLESQLENEITAEEVDLKAEEERLRLGRMSVRDRLSALHAVASSTHDYCIRVLLADGRTVALHPVALGKDWVSGDLIDESATRRQCIVPLAGVAGVVLSHDQVEQSLHSEGDSAPQRELSARLSLAFVLRDLCRRRQGVDLELLIGTIHGTIDRVGRDHIDVALHDRGTPRRESAVTQRRIVPLAQLTLVRL